MADTLTPCTTCSATGLKNSTELCADCAGSGQQLTTPDFMADAGEGKAGNSLAVEGGGSYIEDIAATQPDATKFGQTVVTEPYVESGGSK